jgi:hypothetical protein
LLFNIYNIFYKFINYYMNNINYNQNYNKGNYIFHVNNINYNKNNNIYITIIIFLLLIILIIIKIIIFWIQIIIFIILTIILNLSDQSFYSNNFLKKLLIINDNNNNSNNNCCCYYYYYYYLFFFAESANLATQVSNPRGDLQNRGAGQKWPWRVCRLAHLGLQLYHATPNKFVILRCRVCRPRGAGVQPDAWGLQPHQTVQSTMKSLMIYNNSLYSIK